MIYLGKPFCDDPILWGSVILASQLDGVLAMQLIKMGALSPLKQNAKDREILFGSSPWPRHFPLQIWRLKMDSCLMA